MLPLNDERWKELSGGYGAAYDASPALKRLASGEDWDAVWEEFWNELHHQGDIGEASYAVLPHVVKTTRDLGIVDWNPYGFAATVETLRGIGGNPDVPEWMRSSYDAAWLDLFHLALEQIGSTDDELVVRSILAVLALAKGQRRLGRLLSDFDASEIDELYQQAYGEA